MSDVVDEIRVFRDSGSDTMFCAACGCGGTDLLADAPFSPYAFALHDECAAKFARAILSTQSPASPAEAATREARALGLLERAITSTSIAAAERLRDEIEALLKEAESRG